MSWSFMPEEKKRTERVTVRFTVAERQALDDLARQLKVKDNPDSAWSWERQARASDVVRMAVEEFVRTRAMEPLEAFSDPIGGGA